jgi:aminoglycoside phosphotransferase (APT) family kinase protein
VAGLALADFFHQVLAALHQICAMRAPDQGGRENYTSRERHAFTLTLPAATTQSGRVRLVE